MMLKIAFFFLLLRLVTLPSVYLYEITKFFYRLSVYILTNSIALQIRGALAIPLGILIIRWDNEVGPVLIASHPESLKITNNLLTQIYSAHRHSSLTPGFSSLTLPNSKVVSFFSGLGEKYVEVENYVVALLLRRDEEIAKYRAILNKIAAKILSNIENNKYKGIIQNLYQDLARV